MEYQINFFTNDLIDKLVSESKCDFNSLSLVIPISYAIEHAKLNWNDIFFAFCNWYINNESVIEFAKYVVDDYINDEIVLDLVCLSPNEVNRESLLNDFLLHLIDKNKMNEAKSKFLYIVLSFIFDRKVFFEDPARAVEVVYADFNYPEEIKDFVRFMPVSKDVMGLEFDETERIFNNWKKYLDSCKIKYSS
ncbi:MAG: DUF2247 family protein [Acutalibacteraceae bacterium]